jgi:hypothetical protein
VRPERSSQQRRDAVAVRGVSQITDGILQRMRCGSAGGAESTSGCERAHHQLFTRFNIGAVLVRTIQTLPDGGDGEQREMIRERILADEHMLLRQFRRRCSCQRGERLDRVRQCISTGACGETGRAGECQLRIANSHLRNDVRTRDSDFHAALLIRDYSDRRHF